MIELIRTLGGFLWDYILLFALVGVGLYLTVLLRFPQFTRVFPAISRLIKDIKENKPAEAGRMTSFQSLATAVAAQVGTGNIVGVASAIAAGGPGAAFWMIVSAFFGMSTIFAEAVLAQVYRKETPTGELVGGPAYYIRYGLNNVWLSYIFAVLAAIGMGIVGTMVQSNAIVTSLSESFGFPPVWATIALLVVVGVILTGGMGRIAGFSEKIVPLMAGAYILGSLIIVFINFRNFVPTLQIIVQSAFSPQAVGGGALGITVRETMRFGVARGLFSNEAGLGSTPHSHAVAHTDHPAEQGFIAMIGVFISTFLICTSTAMVNLMSGAYIPTIPAAEMSQQATLMTQNAFVSGFGTFGGAFLSLSLSSFALTTIVGWYFFAESNVKMLVRNKKPLVVTFKMIFLAFIIVGPLLDPDVVWSINDLFTGLMALPNIIALIFLAKEAQWLLKDYDRQVASGKLEWPDLETQPWRRKNQKKANR
ncbi:MAG: sodium:alanine symporter family protein [Tissierellia bacterium]|nr:sodium:alanine symporter family protein [Bacillota bacterium]NLK58265.1 sodium:alanine symporter family protein [Tissierellia bacterium]